MGFVRKALGRESFVDYDEAWLDAEAAEALRCALTEALEWESRAIRVFGKDIVQPRLIAWCGELPYRYSGQELEPRPFVGAIAALNAQVSELVGVPFNHVLLNRYRNGADHMGMHADDEKQLGRDPTIAALSLGVTRRFVLRHKQRKKWMKHMKLRSGSLMVMGGECQHRWHHGVPKQADVEGERINVTFRRLLF